MLTSALNHDLSDTSLPALNLLGQPHKCVHLCGAVTLATASHCEAVIDQAEP